MAETSPAMRQRTREIVSQGDKLFALRYPLLSLWQQTAENFHVMRADFTRERYFSEEFASYLMTGRPAMNHRDLTNAIPSLMRPRDRRWVSVRTQNDRVNQDVGSRVFMERMSNTLFAAMYEPAAGMVRATKECDGDYSAFGNGCITVDPNDAKDGMIVRCWHLKDVVWTEDDKRQINQIHHKMKMSVRDRLAKWPKVSNSKLDDLRQKDPDALVGVRRVVIPAGDYDLPIKNKNRFPFVSVYVDTDNEMLLEEVPLRNKRYVIPRWQTISNSQYAYSPATVYGLPDARMLQQLTLTMLEASQKATDPPMIGVGEAINGGVNSGAGMITWADADYDERTGEVLRPMTLRFDGIEFGAKREEIINANLDAAFMLNMLRMPEVTKEMTAYEASKLYEQYVRQALPLLEPIEVDYNNGLCTEAFNVCSELGMFNFAEMPQPLLGQEIKFEFDSPLKQATDQQRVFAAQATKAALVDAMQVDPSAIDLVDVDKILTTEVVGQGGAEFMRDPQAVAQIRQQKAQQAAAAQAAQALASGADVATRAAQAVKHGSDAAQSLQQASGMM